LAGLAARERRRYVSDRKIRPYQAKLTPFAVALPGVALLIAGVVLRAFDPGDVMAGFMLIFGGVMSGILVVWALSVTTLSRSTEWTLTDEGFSGRLTGLPRSKFAWDEIERARIGDEDHPIAGTGFTSFVVLSGKPTTLKSNSFGFYIPQIRDAASRTDILDEIIDHVRPGGVDPRLLVLRHLVVTSSRMADRDVDAPQLTTALRRIADLKLVSAAGELGNLGEGADPSLLVVLAEARLLMRQFKEATRLCDVVLASDPQNYWASLTKALALFHHGRKDEAEPILAELAGIEGPYTPIVKAFCDQQVNPAGD
jgi:hypothetical protein